MASTAAARRASWCPPARNTAHRADDEAIFADIVRSNQPLQERRPQAPATLREIGGGFAGLDETKAEAAMTLHRREDRLLGSSGLPFLRPNIAPAPLIVPGRH